MGGGNFGVVTEFRYRALPIGDLALFTFVWGWSSAAKVVAAWQAFAPSAPDEIWSNCLLYASQQTPSGVAPAVRVTGVCAGDETFLESALTPLLQAIGDKPFSHYLGQASFLDAMLAEAGCDGDTVAECHLPSENPAGRPVRAPFAARSDIVTAALSERAIASLLGAVEVRQASSLLSGGGVALDASGGAINRVAPGATAFVHRDALFTMQYGANWVQGSSAAVVAANESWLDVTWQAMRSFVSGQAYQNYIDPKLANWAEAYYGANLGRLEAVKSTYDPEDVFSFPQSVQLER